LVPIQAWPFAVQARDAAISPPLSRQARADDGQKPEGRHEPKDTVPGSTLVSCA
jgi:hypothetical protein